MTNLNSQFNALDAITFERNYQDKKWADSASKGHHETGAYLTYIQSYVNRAMDELTHSFDDRHALNTVRKIGALAVACMEDNGVVHRKW